jgi:hypothetical protein
MSVSTLSMCSGAVIPLTTVNFSTLDGVDAGGRALSEPEGSSLGLIGVGDGSTGSVKNSNALVNFICGPDASVSIPKYLRTSVNLPVIAAAAAMAGLTRCVRPPAP